MPQQQFVEVTVVSVKKTVAWCCLRGEKDNCSSIRRIQKGLIKAKGCRCDHPWLAFELPRTGVIQVVAEKISEWFIQPFMAIT